MTGPYRYLFAAMWIAWIAYWMISSRDASPTARRESAASRLSYIVPLIVAVYLLVHSAIGFPLLRVRLLPRGPWVHGIAAAITAAGLLFSVWARRYLGPNWSGTVTIKENHQLITTGPYAIVRHPIYTGLLLAILGSAIAVGEWRAVLAFALALLSFLLKIRIEERWMRQRFGEAYLAYRRRVSALIPGIA